MPRDENEDKHRRVHLALYQHSLYHRERGYADLCYQFKLFRVAVKEVL